MVGDEGIVTEGEAEAGGGGISSLINWTFCLRKCAFRGLWLLVRIK